jgi:putative flippase GtrA
MRRVLVIEFLRFAVVGTINFCVATGMVYALCLLMRPSLAGVPAFLAGATVSWALNRRWTFSGRGDGPRHLQWLRFMVVSCPVIVLNITTYEALILSFGFIRTYPILATAGSAVSGMFVNFVLMRHLVFRATRT